MIEKLAALNEKYEHLTQLVSDPAVIVFIFMTLCPSLMAAEKVKFLQMLLNF